MKRCILGLFLLCFVVTQNVSASVVLPTPPKESVEIIDIGYGVKIPASKVLTLTPKEYKKLTGHRMGFVKSIFFKIAQKKLKKSPYYENGEKSQVAAALLAFFLGTLGIHRFYLGYTWQGIVQILTLGGLGVWALIDFIRILTGDLKPKNGEYKQKM